MIITRERIPGAKPTPEQIAMIEAAKKLPVIIDEDCPEWNDESLREAAEARNELLITLGLPLPSEDDGPESRVEVTEEERRQIDDFWKERLARQRAEAIRKREAAEAAQKRETAKAAQKRKTAKAAQKRKTAEIVQKRESAETVKRESVKKRLAVNQPSLPLAPL